MSLRFLKQSLMGRINVQLLRWQRRNMDHKDRPASIGKRPLLTITTPKLPAGCCHDEFTSVTRRILDKVLGRKK